MRTRVARASGSIAGMLAVVFLLAPACAIAADYRVEPSKDDLPAAELSPQIAAEISTTGFKVMQGEKRTVCEVWPARHWTVKADFQPTEAVNYPFEVGQLMGVVRFSRKSADFRGQEIAAGVYTLRYGNQPVDGNHVGTFETRDFLLLIPAGADQSPKPVAEMDLFKLSAQSAESSHPAIMPLVKAEKGKSPAMRHLEGHDWWTLRLAGASSKGGNLEAELIVVGKAAE